MSGEKWVTGEVAFQDRMPPLERLQKVGEYLRFQRSLEPRISEFTMLVVSREWTRHRRAIEAFGENGVVDIIGVAGPGAPAGIRRV